MAEKTTYVIELNDKLSPGLKKAIANATGLDKQMGKASKKGASGMSKLGGAIKGLIGPLAAAAAAWKAFEFGSEAVRAARGFESLTNAINFASGSVEEGAKNMEFLRQRSKMLGTDISASAEGFKTLSASMIGSSLEGQATRDIFDGVQVAATTLGLSAEDAKGTFLALGQIMGKGKVQAEELRGQIGERIPGAFNIAARAMGVTTAELNKMMEQGQLVAEDFLPAFSDELKKTFGPGLATAVNSSQANFNRFNNTMLELKLSIGNFLIPILNRLMSAFSTAFNFLKINIAAVKDAFSPLIDSWREQLAIWDEFITKATGGTGVVEMFKGALSALKTVLKFLSPVYKAINEALKVTLGFVLKLWGAFDGLLERFPIIGKTFRALVFVIREGFIQIVNFAKNILSGVGDLLVGIFSGDIDQIEKGLEGLGEAFNFKKKGESMSKAWREGFDNGFKTEEVKIKTLEAAKGPSIQDVLKEGARGQAGATAAAAGAAGGKKSSTKLDGVKSGRPTNINIDIGKLIETFNVTATNLEDMNNKAKDLVAQALLSAVNNVNNIAR